MLIYTPIDPIAFKLGPLAVHWYGIMYLIGFVSAWLLATFRAHRPGSGWNSEQVNDLIFYMALGVLIGGRIGYVLFYDLENFLSHPLVLLQIWQGGMSFHGGLLGVLISVGLFAKKLHRPYFAVGDFVAPLVPIGLAAGRVGNFINGELWGRVTTMPWGMVFPTGGPLPRHPSQGYEFLLEGVVLFIVLWFYSAKPKPPKAVSGLFLVTYGLFRIVIEIFRQPDPQLGFIAFGWMTMGQLLSLPMVLFGGFLIYSAYRYKNGKPLSCTPT